MEVTLAGAASGLEPLAGLELLAGLEPLAGLELPAALAGAASGLLLLGQLALEPSAVLALVEATFPLCSLPLAPCT